MLIDTGVTIAYKCFSCGSFEFYTTSLFELLFGKVNRFSCRCRKSEFTVSEKPDGMEMRIPCIGCGDEHVFTFARKAIHKKGILILNCPKTHVQLCFIGKDELVRKKVDNMEKELDEMIDRFGYESYFSNTQVMLDSLNKIHDIAEQGNLCCECGSTDIELLLLPDKIQLRCRKCFAEEMIPASSNRDLRDTLQKRYIVVASGTAEIREDKLERAFTKSDGKL